MRIVTVHTSQKLKSPENSPGFCRLHSEGNVTIGSGMGSRTNEYACLENFNALSVCKDLNSIPLSYTDFVAVYEWVILEGVVFKSKTSILTRKQLLTI